MADILDYQWLSFIWDDFKNQWDMTSCFSPDYPYWRIKTTQIPFPNISDIQKFNIGEIVYVDKDSIKYRGKIENIIIRYAFYEPDKSKGWEVFYDVKRECSGHTNHWYLFEEINKE